MQLRGAPAPGAGTLWNQVLTPAQLLGLNPGAPHGGAGSQLPDSSHMVGDNGAVWWSPDSPIFWLAAVGIATALGITGASVRVRAFNSGAALNLGES